MTGDSVTQPDEAKGKRDHQKLASSYYALLELHPEASAEEIRQAYRKFSRLYHPDTTTLPAAIATEKFQQLNEAYATLNHPVQRLAYNQKIGLSQQNGSRSYSVVQPPLNSTPTTTEPRVAHSRSAYLDPNDRQLSPGEMFALFILGLTFVGCLVLAIAIGLTRGEVVLQSLQPLNPNSIKTEQVSATSPAVGVQPSSTPASPIELDESVITKLKKQLPKLDVIQIKSSDAADLQPELQELQPPTASTPSFLPLQPALQPELEEAQSPTDSKVESEPKSIFVVPEARVEVLREPSITSSSATTSQNIVSSDQVDGSSLP